MNVNNLAAALSKTLKPMVKSALINGGGYAGRAGANAIGMGGASATMSAVGRNLGARISKLIGSGDYAFNADSVTVNSLIKPKGANVNSSFGSTGVMPTRIRHREYVGDVSTGAVAGGFSVVSYAINPGLSDSFPYLSNIAKNYDQYVFHGLVYEFVSSTGSPNTGAMGTVIMASDYNPTATTYANKHNMENSGYAVSARLDGNIMYGVECATGEGTQNGYFVRSGSTALGLESTDYGNMQIAVAPSSAFPTNSVLGELWVTYDIELKRPSLSQDRFGYAHTKRDGFSSAASPLGVTPVKDVRYGNCSNITYDSTSVTFDRVNTGDIYKVTFTWSGSVAVNIVYPVISATGGIFIFPNGGGTTATYAPQGGASAIAAIAEFYFVITSLDNVDPKISVGLTGTLPGGTANAEIYVSSVGSGYTATDL